MCPGTRVCAPWRRRQKAAGANHCARVCAALAPSTYVRPCWPKTPPPARALSSPRFALRPGAQYDNVTGAALDALSSHSGRSVVSFGKAPRSEPKTGDFIFMSAPPTSAGQRHMYLPHSPGSDGPHAHAGFGGGASVYSR